MNRGGSMTGGSASRSAGVLSRANELERLNTQIAAIRRQLEEAARGGGSRRRELARRPVRDGDGGGPAP